MWEHPHKKPEKKRLKEKAAYFFQSEARSRGEVSAFATKLGEFGPTAVVGGMLRDILLEGTYRFSSDVDFVVQAESLADFDRFAANLDAKKNRFGGYAIKLDRWSVDVWPLKRTWASVAGHVAVENIADLLNATFFDWDAVLYLLSEQRILTSADYFARIDRGVIDINLEPNPNPLGNAIRALRYSWRWNAKLGSRLSKHIFDQLTTVGWDTFVQAERISFPNSVLALIDSDRILNMLYLAQQTNWSSPVDLGLSPRQQKLPLDGF